MIGLPDDFDPALLFNTDGIDTSWMNSALCTKPGTDPDLFFPAKHRKADAAKAVCGRCHVRTQCLDYGQRTRTPEGVFGGASARERRKERGNIMRGLVVEPPPVTIDEPTTQRVAS